MSVLLRMTGAGLLLIASVVVAAPLAGAGGETIRGETIRADPIEIPAFARKYGVSCTLCHAPAPRLNAFGEAFAGNGFVMQPGEARDTTSVGDDLLLLMKELPLAMRLDVYAQALTSPSDRQTALDLQTPWLIKILSGGQITDHVSYYLYFFMSERGEVAGLEDAYIQFTDLFDSGIDIIVGQYQVSDPLFKRELRLEYEDYQAYRVRVGEARADLTYDRGVAAAFSPWNGGDVVLQVVNGRGLDASSEAKQYDVDDGKGFSARLSQDVGRRLRVGGFGYFGEERRGDFSSDIWIFGPDATLQITRGLELNLQWLHREDENPFFAAAPGDDVAVDAMFGELVYLPGGSGRWSFTGLFNYITADAPVFTIRQGEEGRLEEYTAGALGANYLLARNLRVTSEVQYDFDREQARLTVGAVTAF